MYAVARFGGASEGTVWRAVGRASHLLRQPAYEGHVDVDNTGARPVSWCVNSAYDSVLIIIPGTIAILI